MKHFSEACTKLHTRLLFLTDLVLSAYLDVENFIEIKKDFNEYNYIYQDIISISFNSDKFKQKILDLITEKKYCNLTTRKKYINSNILNNLLILKLVL